jgi:hypothetical protein
LVQYLWPPVFGRNSWHIWGWNGGGATRGFVAFFNEPRFARPYNGRQHLHEPASFQK